MSSSAEGLPTLPLPNSPSRAIRADTPPPPAAASHPSLWSTLKTLVGKDLSKVSLPVWLNEPLSFLQRTAEDVEYSFLLDRAAATADPADRAALVAAFVVSHYSSTAARSSKPFNPLLGETFEMISSDRGVAFVAEQVQHHPPTTAVHAQGAAWTYHTTHVIRNRYHGNSLEVWPEGSVNVLLPGHEEHYIYDQVHTTVHNTVVGSLWLDNTGSMTIKEVNKGETTVSLRFLKYSCLFGEAKKIGEVSGKVTHSPRDSLRKKSATRKLSGNWAKYLNCDGKELWRVAERPPAAKTAGHNMTAWAWSLNALPSAGGGDSLPCTDSRLRPDQRALESGDFALAQSEKNRVERQQREARARSDEAGNIHVPQWFERREGSDGVKEWLYNDRYFEAKSSNQWPANLPDIF